MDDCEGTVPLFPLPGCVMLPGALMPLHVFEPRYRTLTADLLEQSPGSRCMVTVLLADGYERLYETLAAPIHPVGCLGRVVEHARLDDGRYDILLRGLKRVAIVEEDRRGPYRRARVEPVATCAKSFTPVAGRVVAALQRLVQRAILRGRVERAMVNWIVQSGDDCEELVDTLAHYVLPHERADLKQRVLAEPDLLARATLVIGGLRELLAGKNEEACSDEACLWPPQENSN